MRELIERLEKATGPDRRLDVLIEISCPMGSSYSYGHRASSVGGKVVAYYKSGSHGTYGAPRYTASIDAAVALAERVLRPAHPQMTVSFRGVLSTSRDYWFAEITWPSHERQGRHVSPAIALCIAILRAAEENAG